MELCVKWRLHSKKYIISDYRKQLEVEYKEDFRLLTRIPKRMLSLRYFSYIAFISSIILSCFINFIPNLSIEDPSYNL